MADGRVLNNLVDDPTMKTSETMRIYLKKSISWCPKDPAATSFTSSQNRMNIQGH